MIDAKPLDEVSARAMFDDYAEAIERAEANRDVDGAIDLTCLCSGTMRRHDGDLTLDDLHMPAEGPSLFVDGNVTIRGLLQQEFRAGFLVVFGDLDVGDVATTAMIFVAGNLTVHGTLFGNCTNYMTIVLGHTRAKLLVSAKEHYFCLYGGRTIERIVDADGNTPNLDDRTDDRDALVDGIDVGHDERAVADRLRSGLPLVR